METEVSKWTEHFFNKYKEKGIFSPFLKCPYYKTPTSKFIVGNLWFEFSEFMPRYLTKSASLVSTNEIRRNIVQIAYEELGSGYPKAIHSHLFLDCLGNNFTRDKKISCQKELNFLFDQLSSDSTDSFILGINFLITNKLDIEFTFK